MTNLLCISKTNTMALSRTFRQFKIFSVIRGITYRKSSTYCSCLHLLIKGSGLDKLLGQSNLSITGMENTVVNVTDIKRCRCSLQTSASAIYQQLVKAFNTKSNITVWKWLAQKSETSTMTLYWKNILEMQIHILIFIRALRVSKL